MGWAGLDWTGLDWTGLEMTGLGWTERYWTGLDWIGLNWPGLDWAGLDWTGLALLALLVLVVLRWVGFPPSWFSVLVFSLLVLLPLPCSLSSPHPYRLSMLYLISGSFSFFGPSLFQLPPWPTPPPSLLTFVLPPTPYLQSSSRRCVLTRPIVLYPQAPLMPSLSTYLSSSRVHFC